MDYVHICIHIHSYIHTTRMHVMYLHICDKVGTDSIISKRNLLFVLPSYVRICAPFIRCCLCCWLATGTLHSTISCRLWMKTMWRAVGGRRALNMLMQVKKKMVTSFLHRSKIASTDIIIYMTEKGVVHHCNHKWRPVLCWSMERTEYERAWMQGELWVLAYLRVNTCELTLINIFVLSLSHTLSCLGPSVAIKECCCTRQ